MIKFIIGSSGTGKTTEMFETIKSFQQQGKKICVIVPEQYSNDFDRNLYNYIGAKNFNNIMSSTFSGISRELFQLYGDPNRKGEYADENARMIIIYQAIASVGALKFFNKRKNYNGFAEEILKLITDMKQSGVTCEKLSESIDSLSGKLKEKAEDVRDIYFQYEKLMGDYDFKDNLENIYIASEIANKNEYFKGKSVFFDEFESFNADQLQMIKGIFASAEDVTITLRMDVNLKDKDFSLFDTVNSTYRQLKQICTDNNYSSQVKYKTESYRFRSPDLKYLSENIMRNNKNSSKNAPEMTNIRLFEARDMYNEIEYICATIKHLIYKHKGYLKYNDIAVISNNIEDYTTIIKTAFERYNIPNFLSIERSISHTPIIVFFIVLLDLLSARKFQSEQIFRLLKCRIIDVDITEISILENYCYKWGIDGDVWKKPFKAEDENLDLINGLRDRIITPIAELKKKIVNSKDENKTVKEMCVNIFNYFEECGAKANLVKIINNLINIDKDYEASELKRLWDCLTDVFDSIVNTIGEKEMAFSELANIMRSMIGKITYSVPPQTLDAVMIASARIARLNSPKVVFVIGANDGTFPNTVNLYGIFSDGDKEKLSKEGINISRSIAELSSAERLIVYKSLSSASDFLFVTYPLSDLKGESKYSASVINQINDMFEKTDISDKFLKEKENDEGKYNIISEEKITPDFYAVTKKSAYYHYMQDSSRKNTYTTERRKDISKKIGSIKNALFNDDEYKSRITSNFRSYDEKNNAEFHVSTEIMAKLRGGFQPLFISPTGIETYNKCHFMYFCERCLSLNIPEKIDLNEIISGNVTHDCFRWIVQRKDFKSMSEDAIKEEISKIADKYCEDNLGGDFAKTPRFGFFFSKFKEQLLSVFEYTQRALNDCNFEPKEFECSIYNTKNTLKFDGNDWLKISGKIDRMDIWETQKDDTVEKYLRVIDYKSSKKSLNAFNVGNGTNLQMLIYLFLATDKIGECKIEKDDGSEEIRKYDDYKPAGVLYYPVSLSSGNDSDDSYDGADDSNDSDIKNDEYKNIDSVLKAKGKIVADIDIIKAMENGVTGQKSRYIPVRITKDGVHGSDLANVVTEENMDKLKDFVYKNIKSAAKSIKSGDIKAEPVVKEKDSPCRYCKFYALCGNSNSFSQRVREGMEKAEADAELILEENKSKREEKQKKVKNKKVVEKKDKEDKKK